MKKKILIADDDLIIAESYAGLFQHEGFETQTTGDGQSALQLLEQFRPDALLLDLDLPLLSGVEVIKRVRAQTAFQNLPIIVFTNAYQHRPVVEAWQAGANSCLIKAVCTPDEVLRSLQKAIAASAALNADNAGNAPQDGPTISPPPGSPERVNALLLEIEVLLRKVLEHPTHSEQIAILKSLYRKAHSLTGAAALAGQPQLARFSSAFEALINELCEKPDQLNPSTLRTVGQAAGFLRSLVDRGDRPWPEIVESSRILAVDDELFARFAIESALELADLKAVLHEDPEVALAELERGHFDLILLDIDMPKLTGFELSERVRQIALHRDTPIIFISGMNTFESWARSPLSGANELIAKPFLLIELAVKALTYLLRGQLQSSRPMPRDA